MMERVPLKSPPSGFRIDDLYYLVFRHKWKIVTCALAGILAAALLRAVWPVSYQSEAKLFIRYVTESKAPAPATANGESKIKTPDERGEGILNSELEILKSLDLAERVAMAVGPEKLVKGGNRQMATGKVSSGLKVEIPPRSSVVRLTFKHDDPDVVQAVLNQVIENYLRSHHEVHKTVGLYDDFLSAETGQLRARLAQTEEELRNAKNSAGVISIQGSEKAYTEQIAKLRQEIFKAEAEMVERQAMLEQLGKSPAGTTMDVELPEDVVAQHQTLRKVLEDLYVREQSSVLKLTPQNPALKKLRSEIEHARQLKKNLEQQMPKLATLPMTDRIVSDRVIGFTFDASIETARIVAVKSRIQMLKEQLEKVRSEAASVGVVEPLVTELERKKQLQEANYRYFSEKLEQARIDEALRAGRFSNISVVQKPSPGQLDTGKLYPVLAALLMGGFLAGIGMAWIVESYVDQSVKRPSDVEVKVGLPVFFSLPAVAGIGHQRKKLKGGSQRLLPSATPEKVPPSNNTSIHVAPWAINHPLRSSLEGLRDRLLFFFEIKRITRKPKLVAVTGCRNGAGASTIAAGLAATLSEIGEGNVLLVDMNIEPHVLQLFQKGDLQCGLETALNGERNEARVQDNLYVVSSSSKTDKLSRVLPKSFTRLVPKLRASDYDFIIFDLPAVTRNSITPQLAGYMDIVLMVVESEKNTMDAVRRSSALVKESRARLGIVLNKTREYVPLALQQGV